jgi:hypothetical protein
VSAMTPAHFEPFDLPVDAVAWLLDLWHAIQVLDDCADGDPVDRGDLNRAIYALLVSLPANPFFERNSRALLSQLATLVLKWKASDDAERAGQADARSFMWRAGYYDVVLAVVLLTHGPEATMSAARHVMALYGETFEQYREEFPCPIP